MMVMHTLYINVSLPCLCASGKAFHRVWISFSKICKPRYYPTKEVRMNADEITHGLTFAWGNVDSSKTFGTRCHASGLSWNCVNTCCASWRYIMGGIWDTTSIWPKWTTNFFARASVEYCNNLVEEGDIHVVGEVQEGLNDIAIMNARVRAQKERGLPPFSKCR